jgi:predicted HicB family RNase H-like nuclease
MTTQHEDFEEPLDGYSEIQLSLPKEELYQLMLMAHEQDITLNQLITQALQALQAKIDVELAHLAAAESDGE